MPLSTKQAALLITTIGGFLVPYMSSAVNVALPAIGAEFHMSATSLTWIATSFLLATAIFSVPFGKLSDIYGRKKVYTYGIVIYTISALLLALSRSEIDLISYRVLEGFGSAMLIASGTAILTSAFPPGERGRVLGINIAAVYFGLSMGPFLGGFLTGHFGWRSVFLVNVPLGLIILGLISWKLKGDWAGAKGERFDLIGSVVYGLGLLAIIYGLSLVPSAISPWFVLSGVAILVGFIALELKVENPVLDVRLFRDNRVFSFSSLAALLSYSSTYAVVFFMSLYLQYIKGLSPQSAGMLLIVQPAVQAIFSPIAGRLSDRVEPRVVASAGMLFTALGIVGLTFLEKETSIGAVVALMVVLGFGFAFFSSPNTNAIMSSVSKRFCGVASGTVGTMRLIGQMFSQGIAMLVLAVYLGSAQIVPENYELFLEAMKTAFSILAPLCLIGVFFSLARGSTRGYMPECPQLQPPS
jgi:EmrB/QacA subfamily drug resistance transporter